MLETEAGGANLDLQLADGIQVQFASTARLATFLYSLALQQMQATSFVTDNYNLDMQWLNTTAQPLLVEAACWSKLATASVNPEQSIEDNIEANLALQIAAEAPSSRQDTEVTIHNNATGNPTQITVYAAGGGGKVHDISGGIGSIFESIASIVVNIAAAVFPETGLPYLAAALDAASAGQDFSNGQDLQGVLNLAEAVANGITGAVGAPTPGSTPTTLQATAQVITTASQAVGGIYGIVQSAQSGNAAGILAGALEAAAAGAAGIGMGYGGSTQTTLNQLAAALGTAGAATTMASAFASGNVGQGLVDSLNLYLPAVAEAYVNDNSALINLTSIISDVLDAPTPPTNAATETVTNQGATYTIYEAPANTSSLGQSGEAGSGVALSSTSPPMVVGIVPDTGQDVTVPAPAINSTTLQAPLVIDFSAGGADISLALSPTSDTTDALAAIPTSPTEPGLGHPIGTLEQMVTAVLGLIPLPRVLGIAVGIYQAYQAAPTATSTLLEQASGGPVAPDIPTDTFADQIAGQLEELGGGVPEFLPTQKGASQFRFPNGAILRFDLEPGQYLPPGQQPHINLEFIPGSPNQNIHVNLNP